MPTQEQYDRERVVADSTSGLLPSFRPPEQGATSSELNAAAETIKQATVDLQRAVAGLGVFLGMEAENKHREQSGQSPAYGEAEFALVQKAYRLPLF